jgi:hypothetical protein
MDFYSPKVICTVSDDSDIFLDELKLISDNTKMVMSVKLNENDEIQLLDHILLM